MVTEKLYSQAQVGDPIVIRYVASDPRISAPWESDNNPGRLKYWVLLLILGIVATYRMWRTQKGPSSESSPAKSKYEIPQIIH
jgi:hypothetical protein